MSKPVDPRRRCVPVAEWREEDRRLWQADGDARKGGTFTSRAKATRLSPVAREKAEEGWGRYLTFTALHAGMGPGVRPADRVTPELISAFLDELIELGNADFTIAGRLQEITNALKILAPGQDFSWVKAPGGVPIRSRLEMRKREFPVHDPGKMFEWGMRLMVSAVTLAGPRRRQVQLRDGLMIALLALRAPRKRSLSVMELGDQVRFDGGRWWIVLHAKDMKRKKRKEYPAPKALWPWVERYVSTERRELLGGKVCDAFWVNWRGEPLGYRGIEKVIYERSRREFGNGKSFGPHRFRYGIATFGTMAMPDDPGVTATILGITPRVESEHYERGNQAAAAKSYQQTLAEERRRTSALAHNIRTARQADRLINPSDSNAEVAS